MKELSLHILDIFYNSLSAKASLIKVGVDINTKEDILTIKIVDNGCGMDKEFLKNVLNPFTTTRTTRKVGLGLPLFESGALRCEGTFKVWSRKNVGTRVKATYQNSHIDKPPLGNMVDTIISMTMALSKEVNLLYIQTLDDEKFSFDTREIRQILTEEVSLTQPDVMLWIKEYVTSGLIDVSEV